MTTATQKQRFSKIERKCNIQYRKKNEIKLFLACALSKQRKIWSFHANLQRSKFQRRRTHVQSHPSIAKLQVLLITCFTSKSSSIIKHDRFELSSPSSDGTPLTGVTMCEPSTVGVSGDCTVNDGKGNMVATPSENSDEF